MGKENPSMIIIAKAFMSIDKEMKTRFKFF